ncbi:MAG: hypothetical protein ACI3U8_02225 [Candidatus Onthomonas sp.]
MPKNFRDVRNTKKALRHGAQNGMGPFKQRPKRPRPQAGKGTGEGANELDTPAISPVQASDGPKP